MKVSEPIQYEQLVALVEQLSEEQREDLIQRLLALQAQRSIEEKLRLLDDVKLDVPINEEQSVRRVNWCGGGRQGVRRYPRLSQRRISQRQHE